MKRILSISMLLSILLWSCGDDVSAELHYDGDNLSSPFIEPGIHEVGVRFPSDITNGFQGRSLEEVEFFFLQVPEATELIIYTEGSGTTPGSVLYTADLTGFVSGTSWNSHILSNPVEVTGEDLWIVLKLNHQDNIQSIGCDEGPAVSNGDLISSSGSAGWITMRDRTDNVTNINWNIRGHLTE